VEEQVVAQAGAAARLDGDAQCQVVTALLIQQRLRLGGRGVGQEYAVGAGGRLVLNSHYISPVQCSWVDRWVHIINGTLFRPYSRFIPRSPRSLGPTLPAGWPHPRWPAAPSPRGRDGERRRDARVGQRGFVESDLAYQDQHRYPARPRARGERT